MRKTWHRGNHIRFNTAVRANPHSLEKWQKVKPDLSAAPFSSLINFHINKCTFRIIFFLKVLIQRNLLEERVLRGLWKGWISTGIAPHPQILWGCEPGSYWKHTTITLRISHCIHPPTIGTNNKYGCFPPCLLLLVTQHHWWGGFSSVG